MSQLSKTIKERPKFNLEFTLVRIVSQKEGLISTIRIIDSSYSEQGEVIKTIELYSFYGEYAELYKKFFYGYLELARKVELAIREGNYINFQT